MIQTEKPQAAAAPVRRCPSRHSWRVVRSRPGFQSPGAGRAGGKGRCDHRAGAAGRRFPVEGRAAVSGAARAAGPSTPIPCARCVAIGPERTLEQDPRFAFRIIVDIANKALSPAINDPTTAVLALDQLHRLLNACRQAPPGRRPGARCPGTSAFLIPNAGLGGLRQPGRLGDSPFRCGQLAGGARLRAMLEHLLRILPEARHAALKQELNLLHSATQRLFPDDADRASCTVGDLQGIGGSTSS